MCQTPKRLISFAAPDFTLLPKHPSSVVVEVEVPEGNTGVVKYQARLKEGSESQACNISACDTPLKCEIEGLTAGTPYTVQVKACVPGSASCSANKEEVFTIPPECKFGRLITWSIPSNPRDFWSYSSLR